MGVVLETLKVVGSVGGLCSAAYLIWERLISHIPTVAPVVVDNGATGLPKQLGLVIKNESDWHCYVSEVSTNNQKIVVSKRRDTKDLLGDPNHADTILQVNPRADVLVFVHDARDDTGDFPLEVTIKWQSSRGIKFLEWPLRRRFQMRWLASLDTGERETSSQ